MLQFLGHLVFFVQENSASAGYRIFCQGIASITDQTYFLWYDMYRK